MVSGSFSAGCLEWPRAVSGCLAPAATFFHRPGDWVLHAHALRATSAKQLHADLRPNVECGDLSPLTNEMTLRPSSMRVKSRSCVAFLCRVTTRVLAIIQMNPVQTVGF